MENMQGIFIDKIFYTLDDLEKDCWLRLVNGTLRSKDAFHTASVATLKGVDISLRTVVLRKALPSEKLLHFNTDVRSPKWNELKVNNTTSMLFYNFSSRIQLRVSGFATLHHKDDIADIAWEKTALNSRRCYLTKNAPSSIIEFPSKEFEKSNKPGSILQIESEAGRKNFGVVNVHVQSMDWLWLNHAVHHRALFDYANQKYVWIAP